MPIQFINYLTNFLYNYLSVAIEINNINTRQNYYFNSSKTN